MGVAHIYNHDEAIKLCPLLYIEVTNCYFVRVNPFTLISQLPYFDKNRPAPTLNINVPAPAFMNRNTNRPSGFGMDLNRNNKDGAAYNFDQKVITLFEKPDLA